MAIEDVASLLCYQESLEGLKQQLMYMTYELQSAKMEAETQIRKNEEMMESSKKLLNLLHISNKDRDEAREQLQKLLSIVNAAVESPLFTGLQGRTSSGVTESNSFSSVGGGDSLFDVVSPPINGGVDSGNVGFVQGFNRPSAKFIRPKSEIVYEIARGRALPQKGNLLRAVMEAGPLLKTLMAAPFPRWENQPPLQPRQVPPIGIDCNLTKRQCGSTMANIEAHLPKKRPLTNPFPYYGNATRESSQNGASSVLNFSSVESEVGSSGMWPNNAKQ